MDINMDNVLQQLIELATAYAPKVVMALITLIVGLWLIGKIQRLIGRHMEQKMDESLSKFLNSLIGIALRVMLFLSVAGMFGVDTTSFIALFGALLIGVGMALNGSIGHIASGVMLMIFKPFKVGDVVKIGSGHTGSVEAISAFSTTLRTLDNKRIIIANGNVTGNDIVNISGQGTVGVELTYGIGYDDNIDDARKIILEVGKSCPQIIDSPAQGVVVGELADSSVNLNTRPFCNSEHYWDVYFYMQEQVKKEFDNAGIGIPFPQMDIHMHKN